MLRPDEEALYFAFKALIDSDALATCYMRKNPSGSNTLVVDTHEGTHYLNLDAHRDAVVNEIVDYAFPRLI